MPWYVICTMNVPYVVAQGRTMVHQNIPLDKNDFHLFIYNTIIWKVDSPPCQEFKQGMNAI